MTNEEKAKELGQIYFPNEQNIWARPNWEAQKVEKACIEMAEWKEQQMIEKAVEWLNKNQKGFILTDLDIEQFKQAMKEE